MKKIFTIIVGMLLICGSIWARTPEEAAAIASGFMSQKGTQENVVQRVQRAKTAGVVPTAVSLEYTQFTPANENAVYVFNHMDGGFVLVSAMDDSRDVLGYSDSGRFDKNDIPENMQIWLQMYASELARVEANKPMLKAGQVAMKRAPKTPSASYPVISPILANVEWGQDEPFNNLCPIVNGMRSVSGCVATAMSQIMYAHQYPTTGVGSYSYTSTSGVSASANFGETTYDWANMLPSYNNGYTSEQAYAVATLMHHVGVAANMDYNPNGSGASPTDVLVNISNYFGYDKGVKAWPKDFMTEDDVLSAVANDLSLGNPVYVSAATKNKEGHSFVCDGMKSDGYLHINWGWDGLANGYFALSALDPENQGTGGSASDLAFTERVVMYTGIQPDQGGAAEALVTVDDMVRTSENVIGRNDVVTFKLYHFYSSGLATAQGMVSYFIYDMDGNLVSTAQIVSVDLDPGYYYTDAITIKKMIPSNVSDGMYELEIGYIDQTGVIQPILVKGKGVVRVPMTISDGNIIFEESEQGENADPQVISVADVINQELGNTWQIDLYSANFWNDTPSENEVLLRLILNSGNASSIIGSYVLGNSNTAGTISSALYAVGYYQACYQYTPEDMHLTITADASGALQVQYRMLIDGVEKTGSGIISMPNWYAKLEGNLYYYQDYISYDLASTIPASKALAMTRALSHTNLTEMSYFVSGVISNMRNLPDEIAYYGTARFDISDDGTTKDQFYCYNTKWLNNSSFVTGLEVAMGDDVVVYGQLQNYAGNTPEIKGHVYQHETAQNYTYTIRVKKATDCTMDISNGLWLWWWLPNANGQLAEMVLDQEGWYTTTIATASPVINCLAVNKDVSNGDWSGSQQTLDYTDVTGDICLEINYAADASNMTKLVAKQSSITRTPIATSTTHVDKAMKGNISLNFTSLAALEYYPETGDWFVAMKGMYEGEPEYGYIVRLDYFGPEDDFTGTFTTKDFDMNYSYIETPSGDVVGYKEITCTVSLTATEIIVEAIIEGSDGNTYHVLGVHSLGVSEQYSLYEVSCDAGNGIPTPADLAAYYEPGQLCVCVKFEGEICNDIVFAGTYNNWNTNPAEMAKFAPLEGFEGWYYVAVTDYASNIQGKPVQLKNDGSFAWEYQTGDVDSWELISGYVEIVPGYGNESDLVGYSTTEPVIMISKYFKDSPCHVLERDYIIRLKAPNCAGEDSVYYEPAIIGSFNNWTEGVAANYKDDATAEYVFLVSTNEGGEFKFRALGITDWSNEILVLNEDGMWMTNPNIRFGAETEIFVDYSEGKYTLCEESGDPTDLEDIQSPSSRTNCQKILRDGQLIILRDGKTYTVMGTEIK